MTVCVVSTFEGTTEDYMNMFNSTKESAQGFMVDYELGGIREGKVMLMMNITDMHKMQAVMGSEERKEWKEKVFK
mgnify:CR=1 FL=1